MHRYNRTALLLDDLRGMAGLAIFGAPLVFLEPVPWIFVALSAGALIFLLYLGRCVLRHRTVVHSSDKRIEVKALTTTGVDWQDIDRVALKYYSPKRRSGQGWMQLTLSGGVGKIVIDSGLNEFHTLVRRAAQVIRRNRLDVSVATRANFKAMKIDLPAADGAEASWRRGDGEE